MTFTCEQPTKSHTIDNRVRQIVVSRRSSQKCLFIDSVRHSNAFCLLSFSSCVLQLQRVAQGQKFLPCLFKVGIEYTRYFLADQGEIHSANHVADLQSLLRRPGNFNIGSVVES